MNTAKPKILVIDDEIDIIKYLTTLLEDNNYDVISTFDPMKAFSLAKKEIPDLICLDIMMPKRSGLSLYEEFKKDNKLKDIPIIIVSAFGNVAYDYEDFDFKKFITDPDIKEPEAYFEKPIQIDEFISFLSSIFKSNKRKK
jgi:CheY-like chemotaxis protein